ncbi:MAG: prepilin-type N-terminal cleavage/methylation domain-containing protein [Pirellulales bacterium]
MSCVLHFALRRSRRGVSLVELLVVIAVASVVSGLAATLLVTLLKLERGGRRHLVETASLGRLADDFRRDAAAAGAVVPVAADQEKAAGLAFLRPGGGTVEYRAEPGGLVRQIRLRRTGSSPGREMFRLTERARPVFAVDESDGITIAVLSLEDEAGSAWRLEAIVGGDLRFIDEVERNSVRSRTEFIPFAERTAVGLGTKGETE